MELVLMKFTALSGRSALFPTFSCHPSPRSLGDACSDPAASQPWHLPLLRATPCQHPLPWWIPLYLLQSQHLKPTGSEQTPHSPHSCCRRQLTRRDAHVHTQKEGKVWAKAKVFGFFFFFNFVLNLGISSKCIQYPTPFPGAVEVYFCYRLALLDVKLADKKRQLGECLLGKMDAIVTWPYGWRRPYLSEFKHFVARKTLSKGFLKLGVPMLSCVCSGLQPGKVTGFL